MSTQKSEFKEYASADILTMLQNAREEIERANSVEDLKVVLLKLIEIPINDRNYYDVLGTL